MHQIKGLTSDTCVCDQACFKGEKGRGGGGGVVVFQASVTLQVKPLALISTFKTRIESSAL